MLRVGLIVNPLAGVGGPAAMKGSDGAVAQDAAQALGVSPQAGIRARETFMQLAQLLASDNHRATITLLSPAGAMGAEKFAGAIGFAVELVGETPAITTAADTRRCAERLFPLVDLLVFVGGDGTARDVLDVVRGASQFAGVPVLGVPAGVKMHSGVFATSPRSAAMLLHELVIGGLVAATEAEVKDIDEAGLRRGEVGSQRYGELLVPAQGGYLQHVKSGGKEVEALVLLEIAAEIEEFVAPDTDLLVLGPGSTCYAVKERLLGNTGAAEPTLLGVDVIRAGELLIKDATLTDLLQLQREDGAGEMCVLLSFSRNQGFLLGRGNQQLGAAVLANLAPTQVLVLSSRAKLGSLDGRPLLVDTGDFELDQEFSGLTQIISGYQDKLLYRVQPA